MQAGRNSEETVKGALVRVASHELTHFIQDKNSGDYKALKNFCFDHILKAHSQEEINRQRDQIIRANEKEGKKLSAEDAIDEMVANACEQMLTRSDILTELYKQNASLAEKAQIYVSEFFAKLRKNLGNGAKVKEAAWMADAMDELQKKWEAALRVAAANQIKINSADGIKNTATEGGEGQNSIASLPDGTKYVVLDGNIFLNADGTIMTPREAYNALVGQQITLEDGDVITFIKNLHRIKLFNELFKRYPAFSNISDIGAINDVVNKNIVEVFEASSDAGKNIKQHHYHAGIVDFDKRTVLLFDGNTAYRLNLSIANLTDGGKIAYAKEYMEPATADETAKIKRAETARKISPESTLDNSIRNTSGNVNTSDGQNSAVLSSAALDTDEAYLSVAEKYRDGTATEEETGTQGTVLCVLVPL